jgi:hypothetical protein
VRYRERKRHVGRAECDLERNRKRVNQYKLILILAGLENAKIAPTGKINGVVFYTAKGGQHEII